MNAITPAKADQRMELAELLEQDPGRFEPTTAFRAAEAAADGNLEVTPYIGVSPAVLPLEGLHRSPDGKVTVRSALPNLLGPLGSLPPAYNELAVREERNPSRIASSL